MKLLLVLLCITGCAVAQTPTEGLIPVNGTQLYVAVHGKGEPLVVLHGGPGLNHAYFKPHLAALEKKFTVIYYDQRASGKSATPAPDSINMNFFADDIEALRKQFKLGKINILAHSWGAVLAVHYALRYPGTIDRLVLSNPAMLSREFDAAVARLTKTKTTREDSVARAGLMARETKDAQTYADFFMLSFRASAYNPKNLDKLNLDIPTHFAEASKALFNGLMKDNSHAKDLYPSLNKLAFQVLVIHGEADVVPAASIQKLKDNLPQARVEIFKQSGHFPFVEETAKFTTIVADFLKAKRKQK